MLALVVSDRHPVGVVEQDVGRHEHRVGEQVDTHGLRVGRLLLELRHPLELSVGRRRPEQPGQLGVLRHMALDEHRAERRVDSHREEPVRKVQGPLCERHRIVLDRKSVEVDDGVKSLVDVLVRDPVAQGSEIVAEMDVPRGLHARKNPVHARTAMGAHGRQSRAALCRCALAAHRAASFQCVAPLVSTPVFEGPFDVLLQLILDHKVDVCDVPIAPVVDAFVAHIAEAPSLDLAETSEFLVIAAVLVELKSRRLLPGPDEVDADEELVGLEQRDLLLARLVELQAYSAAAVDFTMLIEQAARSLPRTAGLEERFTDLAPDLLAGVGPADIAAAFRRAIVARPQPVLDLSHVTVEQVSVSEAVSELEAFLPSSGEVTFKQLTSHLKTRMQVIVRFLALLELHKRGVLTLDQGETFGDLHVRWVARDPVLVLAGAPSTDQPEDDQGPDEYEG